MSKTFTCRELGGVCEQEFSGESIEEIMQKGIPHMMTDEVHKESVMGLEKRNGENKEQWMRRMRSEFDTKSENI